MRRPIAAALLSVLALALPACGGSSSSSGPACPPAAASRTAVNGAVTVCAYDIRFDVKKIEATAGPVAITLINKGAIAHNLTIKAEDFVLSVPSRNKVATGTVTLKPGTYEYVCTISEIGRAHV